MLKDKKLDIKKAIKRPGALSKKAKKANMTVLAFSKKHINDGNTLTGRQSRFYLNTLRPLNKKNN
jgi:hypothetical protein